VNWLKRLFGGGDTTATADPQPVRRSPSSDQALRVEWRQGSFPLRAVGESHYQAALARICGGHSRHGHELDCRALIIPEPTNAYDPNARKVVINGALVGYIPRDQAERLRDQTQVVERPNATLEVAAQITGGWRTNQHDEGSFGVKLGIPVRGDINFAGIVRPAPAPKPPRAPTAKIVLTSEEVQGVEILIERLNSTPLVTPEEAAGRYRKFANSGATRMNSTGVSHGVASEAPDHLTQGEEHFRSEMARMNDLVLEQVRIFQHGLDQWFDHGQTFAPYYPYRIAVLLRKAGRRDLEESFLRAYVRHFGTWTTGGSRYAQILERASKMGISSDAHT
jgi:hypothetical protein